MSEFSVRIMERDFQNPITLPPIKLIPEWYSFSAIGGPNQAEVAVTASEPRAVWELLEYLRSPIEINDDKEALVWWGYVNAVEITIDAVTVSLGLDEMYNRVAVIYSDDNGTGVTTWYQDDDSFVAFGSKEILYSPSIEGLDYASSYGQVKLAEVKKPVPNLDFGDLSNMSARLICKGWFETLRWQYYGNINGRESYEDMASDTQKLGESGDNQKLAQSFMLASDEGWQAKRVKLRMRIEGEPTDNVVVSLCNDNGGVPGSVIISASKAASEFSSAMDWQAFEFASVVGLAALTSYWIVIERSGANHSENHFVVNVNEGLGYPRGVLRVYGGSWAARDPDADLIFAVIGEAETTEQINEIVNNAAQFLTGIDLKVNSGVYTSQYRAGETSALYELTELLKAGESSGQRLLAHVNKNRELVVDKEPVLSNSQIQLFFKSDGTIENEWGDPAYGQKCPVGMWARLKDVIPGSLDIGLIADPTIFFIEEAEYNVQKRRYTPTSKNNKKPYSVGTLISEG